MKEVKIRLVKFDPMISLADSMESVEVAMSDYIQERLKNPEDGIDQIYLNEERAFTSLVKHLTFNNEELLMVLLVDASFATSIEK